MVGVVGGFGGFGGETASGRIRQYVPSPAVSRDSAKGQGERRAPKFKERNSKKRRLITRFRKPWLQ